MSQRCGYLYTNNDNNTYQRYLVAGLETDGN